MRTVAGGWQIEEPVYVDAKPSSKRAPAPADEVARFLSANAFFCHLLAARISQRQCDINRARQLYSCGKCEQLRPAPELVKARRPKRHRGDNPESPWRETLYNRAALAEHEAKPAEPAVEIPEPAAAIQEPAVELEQVRSGQVRSGQVRSGQTGGDR